MQKQVKAALKKLGCTFRDCPECVEVINVEVTDGNLIFTDSYGTIKDLGPMDTDISGTFIGSATTIENLPNEDSDGNSLKSGDWAILTVEDNPHVPGVYRFNGSSWILAKSLVSIQIASDTEFQAKTSTTKAISVAQAWSLPAGYLAKGNNDGMYIRDRDGIVAPSGTHGLLSVDMGYRGDGAVGALGQFSFVANGNNKASGTHTTCFGTQSEAIGHYSFVAAYLGKALGDNSTAFGFRSLTTESYMTALGIANKSEPNTLLAIGNGTGDATRNNAFTVFNTGITTCDATIADIDASGPNTLVTKEYCNQHIGSLGFAINGAEQIMLGNEVQITFGSSVSTQEITIDNAISSMIVQKAGVYKLTYKINMEGRTTQRQNAVCIVKVNGVVVPESKVYTYIRTTEDGLATAEFHGVKELAVGDIITIHSSNIGISNTNPTAILAHESFFQVEYTPTLIIGGA